MEGGRGGGGSGGGGSAQRSSLRCPPVSALLFLSVPAILFVLEDDHSSSSRFDRRRLSAVPRVQYSSRQPSQPCGRCRRSPSSLQTFSSSPLQAYGFRRGSRTRGRGWELLSADRQLLSRASKMTVDAGKNSQSQDLEAGMAMVEALLSHLRESSGKQRALLFTPGKLKASSNELMSALREDREYQALNESLSRAMTKIDQELRKNATSTLKDTLELKANNKEELQKVIMAALDNRARDNGRERKEDNQEAVRALLGSPAFRSAVGTVLYEGVFAFLKQADLVGRVLEQLPGGKAIREEILRLFRQEVDRTAGPVVKGFISSYIPVAIDQLVRFFGNGNTGNSIRNGKEDNKALAAALAGALDAMLETPVAILLPKPEDSKRLQSEVVPAIKSLVEAVHSSDAVVDIAGVVFDTENDTQDILQLFLELPPLAKGEHSATKRLLATALVEFARSREGSEAIGHLRSSSKDEAAVQTALDATFRFIVDNPGILIRSTSNEEAKDVLKELGEELSQSSELRNISIAKIKALIDRSRVEKRPASAFVSEANVNRLEDLAPILQASISPAAGAFVRSGYAREAVTNVLYEAIFAFLQSADLVGNVLSTIPVLGPVRELMLTILKATVDQTAGKSIKAFLSVYSDDAVQRFSSIVTSERNREAFGASWSNIIIDALSKPIGSFVPSEEIIDELLRVLEERLPSVLEQSLDRGQVMIEGGRLNEARDKDLPEEIKNSVTRTVQFLNNSGTVRSSIIELSQDFAQSSEGMLFLELAGSLNE